MKWLYAIIVFIGIVIVGCSRTQRTDMVAFKWNTGQHEECVYAHQHIYCLVHDMWPTDPRTKSVSFEQIARMPYWVELRRPMVATDANTETGMFDFKYSSAPLDYSFWDCFKTGAGSPAVQCELIRKPTPDEIAKANSDEQKLREQTAEINRKFEEKSANEAKAHQFLKELTAERLIQLCGTGKSANTSTTKTITYNDKDGKPAYNFKFDTSGDDKGLLSSAEIFKPTSINWLRDSEVFTSNALKIRETVPCLAKQE